MPRFSAGGLTSAGSTTLPIISLYAAASVSGTIREIGVSNTTDTACALKLVRITTRGTAGSALTASEHRPDGAAASCSAFNTHSSTGPSLGDDLGYRAQIGAAKGAGWVWTFGDTGLVIPTGTANGIGVIVENGTGQAVQAYIVWDE